MTEDSKSLIRRLVEQEQERLQGQAVPRPPAEQPPGIHYTQLPEDTSGTVLALEWNVYRREIGRLLAEGHEGRFVLIKGDAILGLFDTWDEAYIAGLERFLREPFAVQEVRVMEPYLRIRGINFPWPSFISQSARRD